MCDLLFVAERLPGVQPPAGPPKSDLLHGADVFPQILVHHADLGLGRSRAVEFSWASRFQNLKLHALIFILEASHENRPRIERDIFIFVK